MRYRIFGENMPGLTLQLDAGESIYTQSGGMSWMTDNFQMETNVRGGLMKGLGRMLTGESLFMATYTAMASGAEITLTTSMPGEIRALQLDGRQQYIAQKSAFLCAQPTVELSTYVNKLKTGLFGGEGFLMQRLSGTGMVFLELDGSIVEIDRQDSASRLTPATLLSLKHRSNMTLKLSRALLISSLVVKACSSAFWKVPARFGCNR